MATPYPLLSIVAVYLFVVLKAGPRFMENRKAFNLNNITRAYNLYQIISCTFYVLKAPQLGLLFRHIWECTPLPKETDQITGQMEIYYNFCWYFLLLRTSEFFETVFFVLRKKQNQVSLLHVYHHITVIALNWLLLKFNCSLTDGVGATINTLVHCIMYSYYFLSSFDNLKAFTNQVKSLITTIQIFHLVVLSIHGVWIIYACETSKFFYLQTANWIIFVVMFVKFYAQTYRQRYSSKKVHSSKLHWYVKSALGHIMMNCNHFVTLFWNKDFADLQLFEFADSTRNNFLNLQMHSRDLKENKMFVKQ